MSKTLRHTTVNALLWSSVDRFGSIIIQFLANIVLARILFPEDFGLIGMLTVFIAVSNSIVDSGFGSALIQRKNPSQQDFSTIFFLNIGLSIILFVILYLTAPSIASFYNQPPLAALLRVLGCVLILNSFTIVHSAIIQKQVDFKKIARINILSALFSSIIATACALKGMGVWSLVFQMISNSFFKCLFFWIMNSWRPNWTFSFNSLRTFFGYGSKLLASGLLDTTYQNLQLLIIGKLFKAEDLGFYTQAQRLQDVPSQTISGVVTQVIFPVFSQLQDDDEKMKLGVRKSLKALVFISFPLMVLLAISAKPLIVLLFTDKWLVSVPYFQLLCASGMLYVLHATMLSILKAKGRSDLFFHLEIVKKVVGVALICVGICFGIFGMIIAIVASSYISYFLNGFYAGRVINYKFRTQLKDITPSYALSVLVGIAVYGIFQFCVLNNLTLLILQIFTYAILYLGVAHIFKYEPYHEYRRTIAELFSRKK